MGELNKQFGRIRTYSKAFEGRNDIVRWDVLHISREQTLKVTFMSKKSRFRQGARIAVDVGDGIIEVNGQKSKAVDLWEDTAPREVVLKCDSKEGLLSVYNIWDEGRGRQSLAHTSGMVVEVNNNMFVYRCNDFGSDPIFDKIVFSIEKVPPEIVGG